MNKFSLFKARVAGFRLILGFVMPKNNEKVYYAVGRGRETGVFETWNDCKLRTDGIANAKYRKFYSLVEAEEFVDFWKNYSSPVKESDENPVSNKKQITGGRGGGSCQRAFDKRLNRTSFSHSRNHFVLGQQKDEEDNTKFKGFLNSYVSPIPPVIKSKYIKLIKQNRDNSVQSNSVKSRNQFRSKNKFTNCNPKIADPSYLKRKGSNTKRSVVKNKNGCGQTENSWCCETSKSCQPSPNTATECSKVLTNSAPVTRCTQFDSTEGKVSEVSVSEDFAKIIKEEVIEVPNTKDSEKQNGECQSKEPSSSDKSTESLIILESALKLISSLGNDESERVKSSLKAILERIFINTNANVNLQMGPARNVNKTSEESRISDEDPIPDLKPSLNATAPFQQPQHTSQMSPSPCSTPSAGNTNFKSADVLALNLRLDSFEKRFDACLKEFGGLATDISNMKAEIKEIKEKLSSGVMAGGSSCPTNRGKDGMLQTTLHFNNSGVTRSYSSYESKRKESPRKCMKRKYSRSDSTDNSKRFANDEEKEDNSDTDLLSRVKVESVDYTSFTLDEEDFVEVYTDGASHSNGNDDAKAGIGVWWGDSHPLNVSEPVIGRPTNNNAEIQAARMAVELAIKSGLKKLKIKTDSEFLINCATRWIHRWKKNGWLLVNGGPVKNRKELEKLDKAASKICLRWEKVPAHSGIKGNEMADRLANEGAARYRG